MVHAMSHLNPRDSSPLGPPSEASQRVFPAHVTALSLARVPDTNLVTLVERGAQLGHVVRFHIDAQHASLFYGEEPSAKQLLEGIFLRSRLGYVVLSGVITREHCGQELDVYKREYGAQVVVPLVEPTPQSGFLTGAFRFINAEQQTSLIAIHETLEQF